MLSVVETINNTINNGIITNILSHDEFAPLIINKLKDTTYTIIPHNTHISDITHHNKYPPAQYLYIGIKNAYHFEKYIYDGMAHSKLLHYWTLIENNIYNPLSNYYISENNTKITSAIQTPNQFITHIQNILTNTTYTIIYNIPPENIYNDSNYPNNKYLIKHDDIIVLYEKGHNISRTLQFWCLYKDNIKKIDN
jgi:hypothetical protein